MKDLKKGMILLHKSTNQWVAIRDVFKVNDKIYYDVEDIEEDTKDEKWAHFTKEEIFELFDLIESETVEQINRLKWVID